MTAPTAVCSHCLCEMAFAGRCGVSIALDELGDEPLAALFAEELGAVIQVRHTDTDSAIEALQEAGLGHYSHVIGTLNDSDQILFTHDTLSVFTDTRLNLQRAWSETTFRLQALRDNSECAQEEFDALLDTADLGIQCRTTFDINEDIAAPYIMHGVSPRVAILREQGVNGHIEMAAAFHRAGFDAVDVHMSDLISGRAPEGLHGTCGVRRLFLRRRAGRRAGMGEIHSVPRGIA